jgi:guanylate kinase
MTSLNATAELDMSDPHHRLHTDTDDGMLLIISGPSGVGKTTITRGVERSIPDAVFSVSWTTRERTAVDVEGVDYHFVTDDEFEDMKAKDGFLETAGVYGKKYGTPREWVTTQLERGRLVILEIDVQGAIAVKKRIPDAYAIFIEAPSEAELLQRLQSRRREDDQAILQRFARAKDEIEHARSSGAYDAFVVNHDVSAAIAQAIALVKQQRAKRRRA